MICFIFSETRACSCETAGLTLTHTIAIRLQDYCAIHPPPRLVVCHTPYTIGNGNGNIMLRQSARRYCTHRTLHICRHGGPPWPPPVSLRYRRGLGYPADRGRRSDSAPSQTLGPSAPCVCVRIPVGARVSRRSRTPLRQRSEPDARLLCTLRVRVASCNCYLPVTYAVCCIWINPSRTICRINSSSSSSSSRATHEQREAHPNTTSKGSRPCVTK